MSRSMPWQSRLGLAILGMAAAVAAARADAPPAPSGIDAKAALELLKGLKGTWTLDNAPPGTPGDAVVYRVTAAGTAVTETLFPGAEHEMLTVYHLDGDDLVLTHYCAAGNQPHLKLDRAGSSPRLLKFDFVNGTNLDPAVDMHMHDIKIHFLPDGGIKSNCTGWIQGKPQEPHDIDLHRQAGK